MDVEREQTAGTSRSILPTEILGEKVFISTNTVMKFRPTIPSSLFCSTRIIVAKLFRKIYLSIRRSSWRFFSDRLFSSTYVARYRNRRDPFIHLPFLSTDNAADNLTSWQKDLFSCFSKMFRTIAQPRQDI